MWCASEHEGQRGLVPVRDSGAVRGHDSGSCAGGALEDGRYRGGCHRVSDKLDSDNVASREGSVEWKRGVLFLERREWRNDILTLYFIVPSYLSLNRDTIP